MKLLKPKMEGGATVMQALHDRKTIREISTKELDEQTLSNLLWAANGINRPEEGRRTAPSAINAQDIDVYVLMSSGSYLYKAQGHELEQIDSKDLRALVAGGQDFVLDAPVVLVLVADTSRFSRGDDTLNLRWGAMDAGFVSENIYLYCASAGLATTARATMGTDTLRKALRLSDTQHLMLNNPVGYKK